MPLVVRSPEIVYREEFGDLCNRHGLGGCAVEIGTECGEFANHFLSRWQGRRLICVDPWQTDLAGYEEKPYDREQDYRSAMLFLVGKHGSRVRIFRGTSEQAAQIPALFPWALDFAYVDGNHTYDAVKQDISLWWPRLSYHGILAGHDFTPEYPGTVRAVCEFADSVGVNVYLTREQSYQSWYAYRHDAVLANMISGKESPGVHPLI